MSALFQVIKLNNSNNINCCKLILKIIQLKSLPFVYRNNNKTLMLEYSSKQSKTDYKTNNYSSILNLKLIEYNKNQASKHLIDDQYQKIVNSNINTPSTVGALKKFHSCDLNHRKRQCQLKPMSSMQLNNDAKSNLFSTKILTIQQIKYQQQRQRDDIDRTSSLKKNSSRKLFVSISKKNLQSVEKKKPDPQISQHEFKIVKEQPKLHKQKLKISVYKDIARKKVVDTAK